MKNIAMRSSYLFMALLAATGTYAYTGKDSTANPNHPVEVKADANNAGLKVPAGFGVLKAADSVNGARHIVVTAKGDIYVKTSGAKNGGIFLLHDENGDGKIEEKNSFGNYGGTGIAIKDGYLY